MACGKAIVASDVPGINNMVKNNITGILVPVLNTISMANALTQLIENKILREKLEKTAQLYAQKHFSSEVMFQKYTSLFQKKTL